MLEQKTKTSLTKRMQGTDLPLAMLEAKFPTSEKVASLIIAAVDRGDFIICEDSLAASVLFTNMLGPTPKRGWGISDAVLSVVTGWLVWPYLRWKWEGMTREDGKEFRQQQSMRRDD
jgi:3-dehydrosphinganine reductase